MFREKLIFQIFWLKKDGVREVQLLGERREFGVGYLVLFGMFYIFFDLGLQINFCMFSLFILCFVRFRTDQ